MPQPKKTTGRSAQTRRRSGSTTSGGRSGSRQAAGARGRSTRSRAGGASAGEAGVDAAAQRVRDLNERIIEASKRAGRVTLDVYESTLKAIAESLEKGPGSSDIDWVARIASTQADFLRDMTKAWTSAAREALK